MSTQGSFLTDRAIQIIADNKIRAAIDASEFDNLPGFGKPAAIFDEPYDPHWWIRRKLRHEQLQIEIVARRPPPIGITKCCGPLFCNPHNREY